MCLLCCLTLSLIAPAREQSARLRPLENLQPAAGHPAATLAVPKAHLHSDPNRAARLLRGYIHLPFAHAGGRQDVRFRYSRLMDLVCICLCRHSFGIAIIKHKSLPTCETQNTVFLHNPFTSNCIFHLCS